MSEPRATYFKCPSCKEGRLVEKFWPWKEGLSKFLKCTLVLWLWGYLLLQKPDWYECPKCGRKKVDMGGPPPP